MLKKLIKIVPSAVACTVLSLAAVAGENWNDPNFVAGAKAEFSGDFNHSTHQNGVARVN